MKLNKSKVAIVSDIHAGVHQNSTTWHKILTQWAEWFSDQCKQHNVVDVIIPGDLFHERNEVNVHTLSCMSRVLEALKHLNIIITVGNHDSYYKERSDVHSLEMLKHWPNITVIDKIYTDTFFGKTLTFCPWACDINQIPKSDIIFGHFEIQGFNVTKTHVCEIGEEPVSLIDIAPLIISGHFHIRDERVFEKGTILYTGCAYELYWGDYDTEKGYHILDIPNNNYTFYPNTVSPKHKKINISSLKNKSELPLIKKQIPGNWIKLIVNEKLDTDTLLLLIEKLKKLNPLDIKIEHGAVSETVPGNIELQVTGIDIPKSVHEYIEIVDIPHKSLVEKYILDTYRKVS